MTNTIVNAKVWRFLVTSKYKYSNNPKKEISDNEKEKSSTALWVCYGTYILQMLNTYGATIVLPLCSAKETYGWIGIATDYAYSRT